MERVPLTVRKPACAPSFRPILASTLATCILLFSTTLPPAHAGGRDLRINEVMAANNLTAINGRTCDWIELYNPGPQAVDLSGYGLTDNSALPYRAKLSGILGPGAYVVFAADKDGLGFSLSREGEHITLTSASGEKVDELSYRDLLPDTSLIRHGDHWVETWLPSPGALNTLAFRDEVEAAWYERAAAYGVVISEVMAANGQYQFRQPNADWVELFNPGNTSVSLGGLYLSDNAGNLKQWAFPGKAMLPPGGRLAVYCAGAPLDASGSRVYVNEVFRIDKSNGAVILSDGLEIIDCVSLGKQYPNVAYGRPGDRGAFRFLNESSFLQSNPSTGCTQRLEPVQFSREGGFADAPFTLALSSPEGGRIYYTLDGSEPTNASPLYTHPLQISDNTVVRAFSRLEGLIDAPLLTHTYLFDSPLPCLTVCISGDRKDFYGSIGIFEKANHTYLTERRINIEMIDDAGTKVNQQAAIRLTGGTSRVFLPRTFSIYARPGLSDGDFRINPFPDRGYPSYKCLTFRAGGTDVGRTFFRDAFLCGLARGYSLMYLASAPAAVYLNGEFFGAFDLRERANKDAFAQWEGIRAPDVIKGVTIIKNKGIEIKGSRKDLAELASFCFKNDLNAPENLEHVLANLDVDSLFAHTAFEMISGNSDMQNIRYYRFPGGQWKLMLFDLDLSMLNTRRTPIDLYIGFGRSSSKLFYGEPFLALMRVPEMRERFFTLVGRILAERFAPGDITATLDVWESAWTPLFERHSQRWSQFSLNTWKKSVQSFRGMLATRPKVVVSHLQKSFSLTEEETQRYFGAFLQACEPEQTP